MVKKAIQIMFLVGFLILIGTSGAEEYAIRYQQPMTSDCKNIIIGTLLIFPAFMEAIICQTKK